MKKLLFICGPNGVGKTTVCRHIVEHTPNTAYVDSDACRLINPFVLDDVTIPVIAKNISDMIRNYLQCDYVDTVLFSYGFHGRRKEVFDQILASLCDLEYRFCPVLLRCEEDENIRRMLQDGRDAARIRRGIEQSRKAFADVDYQTLDVTHLNVADTAEEILKMFQ